MGIFHRLVPHSRMQRKYVFVIIIPDSIDLLVLVGIGLRGAPKWCWGAPGWRGGHWHFSSNQAVVQLQDLQGWCCSWPEKPRDCWDSRAITDDTWGRRGDHMELAIRSGCGAHLCSSSLNHLSWFLSLLLSGFLRPEQLSLQTQVLSLKNIICFPWSEKMPFYSLIFIYLFILFGLGATCGGTSSGLSTADSVCT